MFFVVRKLYERGLLSPVALDWEVIGGDRSGRRMLAKHSQFEPGWLSPRVGFLLGMRGKGEYCNILQNSLCPTGTILPSHSFW